MLYLWSVAAYTVTGIDLPSVCRESYSRLMNGLVEPETVMRYHIHMLLLRLQLIRNELKIKDNGLFTMKSCLCIGVLQMPKAR